MTRLLKRAWCGVVVVGMMGCADGVARKSDITALSARVEQLCVELDEERMQHHPARPPQDLCMTVDSTGHNLTIKNGVCAQEPKP
jgi:hypothetical protein